MWHPSVCNSEILDLILLSIFVCQMDLILNLPLQSYLCCFFVSVKHIIWTQQLDYQYHFVYNNQCTTEKNRQISIHEVPGSSCFAEKALLSSLTFIKSVLATCFLSLHFLSSTVISFEPSEMVLGTSKARGKSLIILLLMNQAFLTPGENGFWFMKLCGVTVKNLQHRISG